MNRVFTIWPTNLENQDFVEEANFEFLTRFLRGSGKEPKSENRRRDESEIVAAFSSRPFDGLTPTITVTVCTLRRRRPELFAQGMRTCALKSAHYAVEPGEVGFVVPLRVDSP